MNKVIDEKLRKLLEGISDSYADFVEGIPATLKSDHLKLQMIELIERNPGMNTSDVIESLDYFPGVFTHGVSESMVAQAV